MIKLLQVPKGEWDPHTYISGETSTWNDAVKRLEKYQVFPSSDVTDERNFVPKVYTSIANIKRIIADRDNSKYKEDPRELWTAYMDEWQYSGASAVPEHIAAAQQKEVVWRYQISKDYRVFG